MASLPKPLIGLLLGTIAFFAIWMVALKPSSSSSGGSQGGVGQYQSAVNQAHQAVTTSNQANAKLGAPTATVTASKPATPAKTAVKPVATTPVRPLAKPVAKHVPAAKPAPASGANALTAAIRAHKVVAVLFYNPAAADDRNLKSELATVPTHGGQIFKLAVPVSQLIDYTMITREVPIDAAPTLVIIDGKLRATTITGWASAGEISQRVDDALAAK
jgi:hypothetical protein